MAEADRRSSTEALRWLWRAAEVAVATTRLWGGNADQNGNGEIDGVDYAGQAGTLTGGPGAAGYFCCYTE